MTKNLKHLVATVVVLWATTGTALAQSVTTASGVVVGESERDYITFKGIPYAAPPVGNLRWRPPAPAKPWGKPLRADDFGNACPQPERPDRARNFGSQGEDCLTLNIWTPKNAKEAPVMVWIHGGAFRIGRAGTPFYSGEHFAKQGVVFVSINYRLGYLGFFAHPALTEAAGDEAVGNYGLMDQIAALKWVRDNISAFGGDPKRVTIFGESAGGSSVLHLMMIDQARGLFAQAISQSGGGTQRPRYLSRDLPNTPSLETIGLGVAKQLGVDNSADPVEAMRAIPADEIIQRANSFDVGAIGFGPTIDGTLLKEPMSTAFSEGRVAHVPLMIGANSYEASVLAAFQTDATDLLSRIGPAADAARRVYKAEAGDDEKYLAELAFGDISFVAPARLVAQRHKNRTYLYHLDYVRERARDEVKGANHGADVLLVFNTMDEVPFSRFVFTSEDREVAIMMNRYWANFAKSGDPNGSSLPAWPVYNTKDDVLLLIGNDGTRAAPGYRHEQMAFATRFIMAAELLGID